ncbi:MAG: hypothetical protein HOV79_19350 [Hamadaea sp.]|nr:hypothetical protein [Hamadaea sp.]
MQAEWFECDSELNHAQAAYLGLLRQRAHDWPLDPVDTSAHLQQARPHKDAPRHLLVWLDLCDPDEQIGLLTVGAYLQPDRIVGDELHKQLLLLPDSPTPLRLTAEGDLQTLADATADWFDALARRPIVRREWFRRGVLYAQHWMFADTNQPLCMSREYKSKLGAPDTVTLVRGSLSG